MISLTFTAFLLALAFGLFLSAAFGVSSRINLTAAGLAAWVLAQLVPLLR